ncbi:MAG TPA: exosortase/archaeosortase family protein [Anaerolineae bacterium]|nr:exosortase/archaeosortase family protein [Anaerolineae bacterium]
MDRQSADAPSIAPPERDWARILAYATIAALLGLLLSPVARWLVRSWLASPYYSHGFLIPPLALFFAWRQWPHVARAPRQGATWPGLVLAAAGLAALVWAMRWQNYAAAALALLPLLAGILLYLEGWARLKPWLFPILLLALMVPLPAIDRLSPWMESFTAGCAAGLARLFGIPVVQQGGEISIPGSLIVVGAPCSGLRSMVTIVTVGVVWVYLVQGRLLARLGLLAALVPLVAAANVVRIAGLIVVAAHLGEEVALGYYHDWSGIVLFALALGAMLILSRALGCAQIRDDIW